MVSRVLPNGVFGDTEKLLPPREWEGLVVEALRLTSDGFCTLFKDERLAEVADATSARREIELSASER